MHRPTSSVLLSPFAACVLAAALFSTASADLDETPEALELRTGQMVQELRSRAARLGTSAAGSANDTLWVGYTPSQVSNANWWGVYAGFGKDGYNRPTNGVPHLGVWDWETPVHGDSLQGWWPLINLYASTGNKNRTDVNRPWWALDFGNMANYVINQNNGRTFGVVGVWHRDGGTLQPAPAGKRSPGFVPAHGSFAAWMGLRAHGDNTAADDTTQGGTGNPFNEDVLMFVGFNSATSTGNDQGFPGYGSQMDQMLYRDIDFAGKETADLTVRFKYRTVLSDGATFTTQTRTGWFDSDPLGAVSGLTNQQRGNFISSSNAGDVLAPRDSFMVYVGAGVENNDWLPAAASLGQVDITPRPVYDKKRRWFGEVLHWDRDSSTAPPKFFRELLSVGGVWPAHADSQPLSPTLYIDTTFTIPSSVLQPMLVKDSTIRLVFRVKTNRGFDDQGSAYSSNTRGAVVVDHVRVQVGTNPEQNIGDFENAGDIDNRTTVPATGAWKSTGKPPGIFHHTHLLADLNYDDLCGRKGDISRQCNMSGVVISAGDHDAGEAAGGLDELTAQRERNDGIMSPTIQLVGPYNLGGKNIHGFLPAGAGQGDIEATEDYYLRFDVFTGVLNWTRGNLWRFAVVGYPSNAKSSHGGYPTWGQMRFPTYIVFNTDPECLPDFEPFGNLVRTSNPSGIPDSIKVMVGKTQQCFRFNVSAGCSGTEGAYFDNVSIAFVDGERKLTAEPMNFYNDAFPANEAAGLPGSADFDTSAAHVKTGLNTATVTDSVSRFDVPGDSMLVQAHGNTARVDLVFRILPGPGNYEPIGRPDVGGIVRRPDSRALVTKGDGSFWDEYRQHPGDFASPNATALHHNAPGGWDPNVWNSARCDTAEMNIFPRLVPCSCLGGPVPPTIWMSTYHESDPHYATLGIVHNRCFYRTAVSSVSDIICDGTVPSYISSRPEHADVTGTTKENTKIIHDGLLTPGAHVEYFFREQRDIATPRPPDALFPDTNVVLQVVGEGSTDGHRWQEFGVLPNAWKKPYYRHPVTLEFGTGLACMLVVDHNDRRGNERVWVGVADTIGATPQRYWGAHNGWHAIGGGNVDDPAENRRGKDGQPGFVSEHLGQPGSGGSWDMYQVKGAEKTSPAGSIGSRKANRTGSGAQQLVTQRSSRQGPTTEMLNAYYTMMLFLSGDLDVDVLGPFVNRSQNDAGIIAEWLAAGSQATPNRGFWAIGDGFAEANIQGNSAPVVDLMHNYLQTDLVSPYYTRYAGNSDELVHYRLHHVWQKGGDLPDPKPDQVFGIRNLCLWSNDVVAPTAGGLGVITGEYEHRSIPGDGVAPAGVYKPWTPASPYMTQVEGWDIEHLTNSSDRTALDRNGYFFQILTSNVWSKLCVIQGTPIVPLDVPSLEPTRLIDFLALRNNPVRSGQAKLRFGLARSDRVEIKIFDVSGRVVRTLADRLFAAGRHELVWDGVDDAGRQAPRGVYFTRMRYRAGGFLATRKLTVLR